MAKDLRIAPNLTLPLDAVTQRFAFLGRIGSGKTYAATKLIELMLDAHAQVVALDPVGKCYGLRVPGNGPAFDIPIFGGLHGDVPLEPTGGALIADLIVDRTLSCVVDVSQFPTDAEKARFASAFAERFFFRKKSAPSAVHVFLEECQEFVPQNTAKGEEMMLHHWTRLAKLGRNFGIGLSLASQRPQEVNKKVLNLTECLFAFQLRGKHERDAVKEWITNKDSDKAILDELPKLAVGDAIVDSPQWLGTTKRVRVYEKRTADVSATPKVGEKPASEQPLTAVDIAKVREAMAATIERAKADDPKALRAEIAALKKERDRAIDSAVKVGNAPVLKKALDEEYRRGFAEGAAKGRADEQRATGKLLQAVQSKASATLERAKTIVTYCEGVIEAARPRPMTDDSPAYVARTAPVAPVRPAPPGRAPRQHSESSGTVGKTPQRMINAILFFESVGVSRPTRAQVAGFVGISASTGTFRNYLSELRSVGFIRDLGTERVELTAEGRAAASDADLPQSLDELHATWRSKFGSTPAKMFDAILAAYPEPISREELAAAAGIDPSTGTFRNYLSELRSPGALEDVSRSDVRAADMLFPEGLR